jgi:hypothetical protein
MTALSTTERTTLNLLPLRIDPSSFLALNKMPAPVEEHRVSKRSLFLSLCIAEAAKPSCQRENR